MIFMTLHPDPVIPGLALPEAFESVDRQLDSALQLCRLHGSVEGQVLSVVTICQELQHLLKLAFVGEEGRGFPLI